MTNHLTNLRIKPFAAIAVFLLLGLVTIPFGGVSANPANAGNPDNRFKLALELTEKIGHAKTCLVSGVGCNSSNAASSSSRFLRGPGANEPSSRSAEDAERSLKKGKSSKKAKKGKSDKSAKKGKSDKKEPTLSPTSAPNVPNCPPVSADANPGNILEELSKNDDFSLWVEILTWAGLTASLEDASADITLIAYSNAVLEGTFGDRFFLEIPPGPQADQLKSNILEGLTLYTLPGSLRCSDITDGLVVENIVTPPNIYEFSVDDNGDIFANGGFPYTPFSDGIDPIQGYPVIPDAVASNGVIYKIDYSIKTMYPAGTFPDIIMEEEDLAATHMLLETFGLDLAQYVDPKTLTVFGPTNDAMIAANVGINSLETAYDDIFNPDADPYNTYLILDHHMVFGTSLLSTDISDGLVVQSGPYQDNSLQFGINDDEVTVNNVTITEADLLHPDGVIHKIDGVLLPPQVLAGRIFDVVDSDPDCSTLAALIRAYPDALEYLSGRGPWTLFAPTDAAFAAIGITSATIGFLDAQSIAGVLFNHVSTPDFFTRNFSEGFVPNLLGGALTVDFDGTTWSVEGIQITTADIGTSNGVIHKLDGVLPITTPP